MHNFKDNKGSFTVEAAIIMSTILMVLFAVMFAFMLLYQNIVLLYSANYAATQGSLIWVSNSTDIETGQATYEKKGIREYYYRIFDRSEQLTRTINVSEEQKEYQKPDSRKDIKLHMIMDAVEKGVRKNAYFEEPIEVLVELDSNLFSKTITVELTQKVNIPFLGLVKYLGGNEEFALKARSSSNVSEPAEYIRNIDLGVEYLHKLSEYVGEKFNISSVTDIINKIK